MLEKFSEVLEEMENKVYYIHKESNYVVERDFLIAKNNNIGAVLSFANIEMVVPSFMYDFTEKCETKRWTYRIHEIPLHPHWDTIVLNNLTLNSRELHMTSGGHITRELHHKLMRNMDVIQAIKYHNINLPIK